MLYLLICSCFTLSDCLLPVDFGSLLTFWRSYRIFFSSFLHPHLCLASVLHSVFPPLRIPYAQVCLFSSRSFRLFRSLSFYFSITTREINAFLVSLWRRIGCELYKGRDRLRGSHKETNRDDEVFGIERERGMGASLLMKQGIRDVGQSSLPILPILPPSLLPSHQKYFSVQFGQGEEGAASLNTYVPIRAPVRRK